MCVCKRERIREGERERETQQAEDDSVSLFFLFFLIYYHCCVFLFFSPHMDELKEPEQSVTERC